MPPDSPSPDLQVVDQMTKFLKQVKNKRSQRVGLQASALVPFKNWKDNHDRMLTVYVEFGIHTIGPLPYIRALI